MSFALLASRFPAPPPPPPPKPGSVVAAPPPANPATTEPFTGPDTTAGAAGSGGSGGLAAGPIDNAVIPVATITPADKAGRRRSALAGGSVGGGGNGDRASVTIILDPVGQGQGSRGSAGAASDLSPGSTSGSGVGSGSSGFLASMWAAVTGCVSGGATLRAGGSTRRVLVDTAAASEVQVKQKNAGLWDRLMGRVEQWSGRARQGQGDRLQQQLNDAHMLRQNWHHQQQQQQQERQQQGAHRHAANHDQDSPAAAAATAGHPGRSLKQQSSTGSTTGNADALQTLSLATLLATLLGTQGQQGQGGTTTASGG
jgi:hypothetical protein